MNDKYPKLNFPDSSFKMKEENGKISIFDISRKKYIVLTPEEWVRQNCLHYLFNVKHFPVSLLAVEKGFKVNNLNLRYDIVAYSKQVKPILLVECKAPEVTISQATFDQIAAYNLALEVPFLMVTNGIKHYCCTMDFENKKYNFMKEIPDFKEINMK